MILYIFNSNTGKFIPARCFLDRGSNRSFVTTECAEKCGLSTISETSMYVSVFGNSAKKLDLKIANVDFYKNIKVLKDKVSINVYIMEKIVSNFSSYEISERQKNFINDKGITLADPDTIHGGELKIDFLLGQDICHLLTKGDSLFLPGGSILVPTWDGRHMLAGPLDKESPDIGSYKGKCQSPKFVVTVANIVTDQSFPGNKMSRKLKKLMHNVFSCVSTEDEMDIIETFRSLELLGISPLDYEISPVLAEFNSTTTFDGTRYTVRLPFRDPQIKQLSNNFLQAYQRLMSGYKRRLKPKFLLEKEKYQKSFEDELERGILERVETLGTISEVNQKLAANPQFFNKLVLDNGRPCCYMPHQAVYKSSTGKFRRVHDGKARPFKGAYSLNDCLEKGPNLMSNILHILMGFRKNKWACKSDIEKAFPQVAIHEDDRDVLRCLWMEGDQIVVYRFARLPFGLTCSPMILAATLQKHLGEKEVDEKTKQNFIASLYVDDSVWSEKILEELLKRKELYTKIFLEAGMNFREWTSNNERARKMFGALENREPPLTEKVLGMKWDLEKDIISVNDDRLKEVLDGKLKTKRHLWKMVPSIYDPMGLLCPYVLRGKMIISEACEQVKGWDAPLPQVFIDRAKTWAAEFNKVGEISFNRFAGIENPKKVRLMGCCDASTKALGACVYLVSTAQDGTVTSNLVLAKSRSAPKVKHSIPRMELLAAILLINVMEHVRVTYSEIPEEDIFYFSDSADVIFWIYSGHFSWRPFVANQLKKIKQSSRVQNWVHIDTSENPADLPSRGTSLNELLGNSFWKHGPKFWKIDVYAGKSELKGYNKHYVDLEMPEYCKIELKNDLKKQLDVKNINMGTFCTIISDLEMTDKPAKAGENKGLNVEKSFCSSTSQDFPQGIETVLEDISKYCKNNFNRLMAITESVLKAKNCFLSLRKSHPKKPIKEDRALEKMSLLSRTAEIFWIQAVQHKHFADLFKIIDNPRNKVSASSRSLFVKHAVFLDPDLKILRCRTRNEFSGLSFSEVYPILLPSIVNEGGKWVNCFFSYLLVKNAHSHIGHMGVPNTLSHLRSHYWILQGRSFVKKVVGKCIVCRKVQGTPYSLPPHPSLPEFRVMRNKPWHGTGIDFLGPFNLREGRGKQYKAWYLVFSCGSTRAIHVEAVKSRGIDDFIKAIQRFMNDCGIPASFVSDHEGSFGRLSKELDQIANSKRVKKFMKQNHISWNFYTQKAPNKGGFVEIMNAAVKRTVYKVLAKRLVSFEEFRTLATYIKSVCNDRPLTYLFSDIESEVKALSPSMLLCGYNKREAPYLDIFKPQDPSEVKISQSYHEGERIRNLFWKIWQKEYLKDLFERHVRQKKACNELVVPKVGEVVLINPGNKQPRRQWKMGKVVQILEKRGSVRECTVQTLSPGGNLITKLNRSPNQLIPLEVDSSKEIFDIDSLINLEGDPRDGIARPLDYLPVTKVSKEQLKKLRTKHVLNSKNKPYNRSQQFINPGSVNTGPDKEFVSKTPELPKIKKVRFDFLENWDDYDPTY